MINLTDLQECEVLLVGSWMEVDTGDLYTFTTEKMQLKDDVLYKQLLVTGKNHQHYENTYALAIVDNYCAVLMNGETFVITEISRTKGSGGMKWENSEGLSISFEPA